MGKLTSRQRKFIDIYAGNGTEAARLAGYTGTDKVLAQTAHENLRKPEIRNAIELRQSAEVGPWIASRQDRQKFWSDVMNDKTQELRDRLRASELLGKSEADFTDKTQIGGALKLEDIIGSVNRID